MGRAGVKLVTPESALSLATDCTTGSDKFNFFVNPLLHTK